MMDFDRTAANDATDNQWQGPDAELTPEAMAARAVQAAVAPPVGAGAMRVVPGPDGVVVLPDGVALDQIRVSGRDLLVQLPDGSQMLIVDGAVLVPQLVIGGVEVPPLNLAALLIGHEPQPAAGGAVQSSGGNFVEAVGTIGDPFGLGDLLPPTELNFPEAEEREVIPGLVDDEPTTIIVTPDNPAGASSATSTVSEAGLPARGTEPAGSNSAANSETVTGTILFVTTDGLRSVTLNGVAVTQVGQTVTTPLGTLTITSIGDGAIGYSYTLTDNSTAANPTDIFAVVVTDADGDVASANLTITIVDDVPTARADTDTVAAGAYGPETGNVLTGTGTTSGAAGADTPGADGASLTGIRVGTGAYTAVGVAGATIAGQYGTLTISANGNYSYVRNAGSPGGVTDVFGYQITDGDGDVSTTTLTISIADSPAVITFVPTTGDGTTVFESGLPARPGESPGSDQQSPSETTSGKITYTAPDSPATVTINGVTVTGAGQTISTPTGQLTITSVAPGTIGYSFTLADNTAGDSSTQTFTIVVTDADGDAATAPLVIRIVDDVPTARNDSAAAQEDKPVVINVFANDTPGADGVSLSSGVALATPPAKGTAVYNGDGTFTYTPTPGQEGTDSFTYTITDGDGDRSTATVTITLAADSVPVVVATDSSVQEAALPFGSNPGSNAETTTGTLAFTGGADGLKTLTVGGVDVTNGGTVTGSYGTLTVTVSGGVHSYSYTLAVNTSGDATAETFAVVATDSDGDVANDTLTIAIIDDVPTARNDTDSLPAASLVPETGNVVTGAGTTSGTAGADTPGADGARVTSVSHGATTVAAGTAIAGDYGTLTLGADGSYSYVRTPGTPSGVTEVFTYALTDGDGDVSTATLTLSIGDSTPSVSIPVPGGATTTVYEAALAARGAEPQGTGEEAAAGPNGDPREAVSGTITFSSPDGIGTLSLGGTAITPGNLPQTVASNATGTLVVTGFSYDPVSGAGSIAYTYTLIDNTLTDPSSASFALVLTDADGDSAPAGNLVIAIVDDAPIARPDVDSVGENGPLVADGNVLTGVGGGTADSQGADGAAVVAVAFGASQGTLGNPLAGAYGDLVLTSAGTYTYTLDPSNPAVQTLAPGETLTEVFTYTLRDGDGDPAVTTLTIVINGADDGVTINGLDGAGAEEVVNEDDLFDGSSPDAAALTQTGTFSVSTPDGLDDVTVGGTAVVTNGVFTPKVIDTPAGALSITGFTPTVAPDGTITGGTFSYSYVLQDNLLTHPLQGEDSLLESFLVTLTDSDGSSDTASLDIRIIDDVPTARNDVAAAAENTPVVIDVPANDTRGADGVSNATGVALATQASKGVAVYNGNGTFTYTAAPGAQGNDSFTYTITDGDGDTSTALVTITLPGDSEPIVSATDLIVDEAGLPGGSNAAANSESAGGTLTINTGNDSIGKVEIQNAQGQWIDVTAGGSVQGADGVLVVSVNAGVYSYVYTLTDNLTTHPDNVVDLDGDRGADDATPGDSFAVRVTDNEGDVSPIDRIDVTVLDDGPTAVNDPAQSVVEGGAPIGGNVLSNDVQGADGATVTSVTIGGTTTAIAPAGTTAVVTANGSYSFTAAGVWTFTPNASIANGAADTDASFSYTLTDGDGDRSTANQPIAIRDGAGPSITDNAELRVDEEGLNTAGATGTSAGSGAAADSDTIAFQAGSDAIASVAFGDVAGITVDVNGVAGPDIVWTPTGTTVITGSINGLPAITITLTPPALPVAAGASGQATVSVTLTDNFPHPDANGENVITINGVTVVVNDLDGDATPATVMIEIVDDIPTVTAVQGGTGVTLDETAAAIPGFPISQTSAAAVITANLVFGADGPATANATSYGLALTGNGTTALKTAIGDFAITLVQTDAATITGTYNGNNTAFTLSIGADGKLSVVQSVALEHNIDGSDAIAHNDALDLSGLVVATVTIRDGDGDSASGQVAVGNLVTFLDDGPSIAVSAGSDAGIVLTTHDAATIGANSDAAVSLANFGGVFSQSSSAGADGGSAPSWGYQLAIVDAASGLSSAGEPITLSMSGGAIEGRTASNGLIFSIAVDGNGVVTLTQYQQIDHADEAPNSGAPFDDQFATLAAGHVTLTGTATITDNDGDTASDSRTIDLGGNIRFADHGPTIDLANVQLPSLSVDETSLGINDSKGFAGAFIAQFGADGAAAGGGTSYALGVVAGLSGLVDTASGEAVLLRVNPAGTVVEGYFGGGAGTTVFTLSVDPASGSVTLDQIRAVMHTPDSGVDQPISLAANLITLTATDEDFDGDTASATLAIGDRITFRDDAPTANPATSSGSVDEDGLAGGLAGAQPGNPGDIAGEAVVATGSVSALFNPGADGGLTYQLLGATGGLPALSSGGTALVYGVVGNTLTATAGPGGLTVFTFTLTAGTGGWTFTLARPLDHATGNGENDLSIDFGSLIQATDKDGDAVPATGSVIVTIDDDSPAAANDTDAVVEDGPLVANGNVITGVGSDGVVGGADGLGADGAAVGGPVTAIAFGATAGTVGTALAGAYGTLTLNADGSYQYLLDNNNAAVQALDATDPALTEVFTYTITDRDGDTSTATLTISITGANDGPTIGNDTSTVSEEGLANGIADSAGTNDTTNSAIDTTGHVTIIDPDGDPVIVTLGDPGAVLTADGQAVTWSGVGTKTLIGSVGPTEVIRIVIDNAGNYTVTLSQSVDHALTGIETAGEDQRSFNVPVSASDGTVTNTSNGAITVVIEDDSPDAADDNVQATESGAVPGNLTGNVLTNDASGADTPSAVVSITGGTLGNPIVGLHGTLTISASGAYSYVPNASVASGAIDSFTYTMRDADGDTSTAVLRFTFAGDVNTPSAADVTASVDDDGIGGNAASSLGDLNANTGDADGPASSEASFSGNLGFAYGLDGAAGPATNFLFTTATGSVGTETVSYAWNDATSILTATITASSDAARIGQPLFTVLVNQATGAYTLTLARNVLHASLDTLPGDNSENDATTALSYTVTDSDGSPATGSLTITFDDDMPSATNEPAGSLAEGATLPGSFDFVGGADGAQVTAINGTALVFQPDGYSQAIDVGDASIRVKADGTYILTADASVAGVGSASGTFTVTDADGDAVTGTFSFSVTDANVPTAGSSAAAVDDDGLAGGNAASTSGDLDANTGDADGALSSEASFSGTLTHNFGGDGPGAISFVSLHGTSGTVGQETVVYSWNAGTNTLTATSPRGVLFSVQITNPSTGAYTVTLIDNVLHAQGPNNENDATVSLSYSVTDADGSVAAVPGTLTITFDDDAPTATNEPAGSLAEGTTLPGSFDFVGGADGATVTAINGTALVFQPDGYSQSIDVGAATIRVKADGTYILTADASVAGTGSASGSFTVTDGDGDTATGTFSFSVTDANVPTAGTSTASVDDDGLTGGNAASTSGDLDANIGDANGALSSEASFSGILTHNFGGDGPGAIGFAALHGTSGTVGQETVTYSWNAGSNTLTATGPRGALFSVQVTNPATGAYTVTLIDNVLHAQGPNNENDATVSLSYSVTDSDGSVAAVPGTLTITFDDDAPTATNEPAGSLAEGTTLPGSFDFFGGADGATVTAINGTALTFQPDGYSQAIDVGAATIRVKPDGTYILSADASVLGVGSASGTFTVTDGDGDTATGTFSFSVTDANVPTAGSSAAAVDDDGLVGGNAASTTGDLNANTGDADGALSSEASFSGILTHNFGGDGAGTIGFASLHGTGGTVGQESVTYGWNAGTNTLTATGPRGALFSVQVTNPATGAYTVTLIDNVLHAQGPNNENDATVSLSYSVTDADGSVAAVPGTLTITFDDDAPSAFTPTTANVTNAAGPATAPIAANFAANAGADGVGDLVFNVTNGTQLLDTTGKALQFGGEEIFLQNLAGSNGHVVQGRTADGDLAFTATLNPGGDSYTIDLEGPIYNIDQFSFTNVSGSVGGGNNLYKGLGVGSLPNKDILISGNGTVNTNSTEIGIDGGNDISAGDIARFDMVLNLTVVASGPTNGNTGFTHSGHYEVGSFVQKISTVTGGPNNTSGITVTIKNGDGDFSYLGDATGETPTPNITVRLYSSDPTAGPATLINTFTNLAGNSVAVTGMKQGYYIEVSSTDPFSIVEYSNKTATDFKLGAIQIETANILEPFDFRLPVRGSDADGDQADSNITVHLSPPAIPPVAFDLDGDGVEFVDRSAGVTFDYDGNGSAQATAWVGPDDGILAIDANGDGRINDASELVFGRDGQTDLQGLAERYDTNHDGILSAADADFGRFGVWQDANGNGVTDAGEFRTLAEAGIVSLSLTSDGNARTAANGDVVVHGETRYVRADGSTGIAADAAFVTGGAVKEDQKAASAFVNPGFGQALVAAGLVAAQAASATPPNPPQPGTNSSGTDAINASDGPHQSDVAVEAAPHGVIFDIAVEDHRAAASAEPRHALHSTDGEDGGRHGALQDGAAADRSSGAPVDTTGQSGDVAAPPMPAFLDMAPMPAIPAALIAAAAAAHGDAQKVSLGEIVADALAGEAGPDIDALLAKLPAHPGGPGNVIALFGGHAPEPAMPDWQGAGPHADPVAAAHEAVMAVTHAVGAH